MPVTSDIWSRVVAAPARKERYNIPDKEIKGFGVRILPNGRKIWFLQVMHDGRRIYRSVCGIGMCGSTWAIARNFGCIRLFDLCAEHSGIVFPGAYSETRDGELHGAYQEW